MIQRFWGGRRGDGRTKSVNLFTVAYHYGRKWEMKQKVKKICYLCGDIIENKSTKDHVPPKQIFAPMIRQQYNLDRIETLPTHKHCNESYRLDEEYFTWTLAPMAIGSPVANAVVANHAKKFRAGRSIGLGKKILNQMIDRPSGLYLPKGIVVMKAEGKRIHRVAWKIIRGLYRIENNSMLPEDTPNFMELIEPASREQSKNIELWEAVKAQPSMGTYARVFDYKYLHVKKKQNLQLHLWGMLFWDRIMIFVAHHNPTLPSSLNPR